MFKTVVGLFDTTIHARDGIHALVRYGVDRGDISLVAPPPIELLTTPTSAAPAVLTGAGVGATLGGIGGVLLGLAMMPIPGFGPMIGAGPIVAALSGLGFGAAAGGLVGVLVHDGVPEAEAPALAEGVRRGGTLLSVRVVDDLAEHVAEIMDLHHAVNINERVATWRVAGWRRDTHDAIDDEDVTILATRESGWFQSDEDVTARYPSQRVRP